MYYLDVSYWYLALILAYLFKYRMELVTVEAVSYRYRPRGRYSAAGAAPVRLSVFTCVTTSTCSTQTLGINQPFLLVPGLPMFDFFLVLSLVQVCSSWRRFAPMGTTNLEQRWHHRCQQFCLNNSEDENSTGLSGAVNCLQEFNDNCKKI